MHTNQGRYREAEEIYQRVLTIREEAIGEDCPQVVSTLNNLALVYAREDKYGQARSLEERALVIAEKTLGASNPEVAWTLNNLAIAYAGTGDTEKALAYSRRATAAVIAHAATESRDFAQNEKSGGLIGQRAEYFQRHVANLAIAAQTSLEPAIRTGSLHNFPVGKSVTDCRGGSANGPALCCRHRCARGSGARKPGPRRTKA